MRNLPALLIFLQTCFYSWTALAGDSCVTDKCHSTMGREKYVHGPVAVGECTVCHERTGDHKFKPITNVKSLCAKCHDAKTGVHSGSKGTASLDCGSCHDAHQSPQPQMLLGKKK